MLLPLAGALAVARCAELALRPRNGLIKPDRIDARDYFSIDDIARSRDFARPQLALHGASALGQGAVLLAGAKWRSRQHPQRHPFSAALLQGAGLSLLTGLSASPLSALAHRRAVRAGLSTQPWGAWVNDLLKSAAMTAGFSAGAGLVLVELTRRYPNRWWLVAGAMSTAGQAMLTFLAPVILDPVFNRFDVLEPGPVREDVLDLSRRAGVDVGEVYRVDASRRTRAANAYITGLGSTRRVVLFDTLLDSFTPEQIRLVVAHELAHVRHRDLLRSLAQQALNAPASMYATSKLQAHIDCGAKDQSSTTNLAALVISLALIGAITGPCGASLSRRVEARADAFALALTGLPEHFIAFQQQIVRQNLEDPQPSRWLRVVRTHPTTVERIGTARAYARGLGQR